MLFTYMVFFSVILIAPGLSEDDYKVATAGGPTFIETDTPYPALLEQTGWRITEHIDQTAEYDDTFRKFFEGEQANRDEFIRIHGEEGAETLYARRKRTIEALDSHLLRRQLFGVVPGG